MMGEYNFGIQGFLTELRCPINIKSQSEKIQDTSKQERFLRPIQFYSFVLTAIVVKIYTAMMGLIMNFANKSIDSVESGVNHNSATCLAKEDESKVNY